MSADPALSAAVAESWFYIAIVSSFVFTIAGFVFGQGRWRFMLFACLALAVFCWWLYAVFMIGATGNQIWHTTERISFFVSVGFIGLTLFRLLKPR